MAAIDIRHPHSLPMAKARTSVEQVAAKLADRFGVAYAWQGDALDFKGAGVDGRIDVRPDLLHVTANLGFLLSAMRGPIEAEIRRVLDEKF
jgi:putative polyhydroxyalkanoate system protein